MDCTEVYDAYVADDRDAAVSRLRDLLGESGGTLGGGLLLGLIKTAIEKFMADPAAAIGFLRTILALFGITLPGTSALAKTWESDSQLVTAAKGV